MGKEGVGFWFASGLVGRGSVKISKTLALRLSLIEVWWAFRIEAVAIFSKKWSG